MKKLVLAIAATLALAVPAAFAADHGGHGGGHSSAAHEEVVDAIKVTFIIQTMSDAMKEMGMEMPKGVRETHHISLAFKDTKSGKTLMANEAKIKVIAPDKSEQTKDLMGMHGHFGADLVMSAKGKYGVMSKFQMKDGKVRQVKFWYQVK